jgi:hypothetical protein
VDAVGYGYFGFVWPNGWFQTNLVVIPSDVVTNLSMGSYWGFSTNELRFEPRSNSLAAVHAFDLAGGGRGGRGDARGGLLLRNITFTLVPDLAELGGTPVPLRLTVRSVPPYPGSYAFAHVQTSVCEWNSDPSNCSNVVVAMVTSTNGANSGELTNYFNLRIGRTYRLTALLTAGAGEGPHNALYSGTNFFSFESALAIAIDQSEGKSRLCVKGWPGRRYALERSSDLSAWQPLVTNSSPTGAFEYVDETAANAPSRFYRAVERTSPE